MSPGHRSYSLLRLLCKLNKVTLGRFWNSAHHLINTRKYLQLPREEGNYHCVLCCGWQGTLASPVGPPSSIRGLPGWVHFKSSLRVGFWPGVVISFPQCALFRGLLSHRGGTGKCANKHTDWFTDGKGTDRVTEVSGSWELMGTGVTEEMLQCGAWMWLWALELHVRSPR